MARRSKEICDYLEKNAEEEERDDAYDRFDEGDFTPEQCCDSMIGGTPIPPMCPITDDHASDPCRGPLCAHFRAFSRSAYVEKVTEGLRDYESKTNGLLKPVRTI
ncbi:uncharacterized protein ACA1_349450 [Acanthamoeba castellanii str. Neff]|uniref:Uncharacterized protein n=1 Tax=Acanthamoeba castellanii (strain ATCC 30010 / Neff) TaxID=1257118 RepID=L8GK03_ACACF|nr:uncharacterized protein ACA1_349450 [Acanthamoeba castellanii str. Neff]ELR13144.1 hypothetical protein ACA1_349450 [Acanthamoeba castellanii str. Neff]